VNEQSSVVRCRLLASPNVSDRLNRTSTALGRGRDACGAAASAADLGGRACPLNLTRRFQTLDISQPHAGRSASNLFLPTLEAERLIIRPLASDDLENCHRLFGEIGWADAEVSDETNRERRRSWLEWTIAGYREFARLHQPQYGERAIASKTEGAFLGLIGMVPCLDPFAQLVSAGVGKGALNTPEVGLFWALLPAAQVAGLATEAARTFTEHLFAQLRLKRLVATTERANAPSIAVMNRLGMLVEENPFSEPEHFEVVGTLEAPA